MIDGIAIYVLWLREMTRFLRAKSRVIGTLAMPLFFMAFLGFGFSRAQLPNLPPGVDYIRFLVPGIVGMTLLFSSTFSGISVLWDREFGFLKEIMVAPVSRVSIVLGRIAGGATTSLIQGVAILLLSIPLGFGVPGVAAVLLAALVMILISVIFIGLGLVFASNMRDIHGFNMITNFVVFPIFLLSGALFPVGNLPAPVQAFAWIDPLTYGVDALRAALLGTSTFPLPVDLALLLLSSFIMVSLAAFFFERCQC
ncbi:MAG TPA: ABC transporter permease [Methanomicrobiales archaeon]|nr:ABC transporter permease [Methanomicrobiales archaeon]